MEKNSYETKQKLAKHKHKLENKNKVYETEKKSSETE